MKIEIASAKNVVIDTDELAQNKSSTFPIHVKQIDTHDFENADHTAVEIEAAIKDDLLPVLFLDDGVTIIPCHLDRVVLGDTEPSSYEFRGFTSYHGSVIVAIGRDGSAWFPK